MSIALDDRYQTETPVVTTSVFTIGFPIFSLTSDVEVYIDGTLTAAYAITGSVSEGSYTDATLTLDTGIVNQTLEIIGARNPRRPGDLINGTDLITSINAEFDVRTAELQEAYREIGRAIRLPYGLSDSAGELTTLTAGKLLAVNATANGVTQVTLPDTSSQPFPLVSQISGGNYADYDYLWCPGYASVGDGGGSIWMQVGSEPSSPGKKQSADGAWFKYVPDSVGINVRAFGAINNGASDDGAAIEDAWQYGWANPLDSDGHGVTLFFPPYEYLVTQNDVLGNPGVTGQRRYGNLVGPGGMGGAKIVFQPTTGNSTFSDNKYFLFDGGDGGGVNFNTFHPQFFRIKNLHFVLDKTNLTTGDEIWLWRMDGESASQNLEMTDVRITGTGSTGTGVDAESGWIQLVGSTNSSECVATNCRLQQLSHIAFTSNPQAVGLTLRDTHCLQIYDNFFEISGGAAEIYLHGGGYIWADTPDNATQYLFSIDSSSGNPGSTSSQIYVNNIKPEMRHAGAALVNAPNTQGIVEVTFNKVNFTGGGVAADGDRDVTVLNSNKSVRFVDCVIPDAFGHEFLVLDNARAGQNWSLANLGLVEYLHSTYDGDLSAKITLTGGDGGRVIAKDCKGYNAEASPYNQVAMDFDSNPFVTGHKEPAPWLKTVKLVDESVVWNSDDDFVTLLPYGAIIDRVQAVRFAGSGGTSRDLKITDGDAVELATDTSTELAGFDAAADISLADNTGLAQRRTTTNKRTITAGVTTTLTGNTTNGRGYIRYW